MTDMIRELRGADRRLGMTEVIEKPLTTGTAFPTGIAAGFLFFRTDVNLLCVYDGTRWITADVWAIVLLPNRTVAAADTAWDTRVRTDHALYVEYIALSTNAAAVNNGTNFWTITIQGVNLALTAATTVYNPNTSADTAGVETDHSGGVAAGNVAPANNHYLRISVNKTLAPGNLTIACTAYVRMIIT